MVGALLTVAVLLQWQSPNAAQQLALHRYVLDHCTVLRAKYTLIGTSTALSDNVLLKLQTIEPKLRRGYIEHQPSIQVGSLVRVENGALLTSASFHRPFEEGAKGQEFHLFLSLTRGRWSVRETPKYPAPPAMLVSAVAAAVADDKKSSVFVDASDDVMKLLRSKCPRIRPRTELNSLLAADKAPVPWVSVWGIEPVWLDRSRARVYLTWDSQPRAHDVTYEYGGPVLVWKTGRAWKAKRLDMEWAGE